MASSHVSWLIVGDSHHLVDMQDKGQSSKDGPFRSIFHADLLDTDTAFSKGP
jgi:hypothetical protein